MANGLKRILIISKSTSEYTTEKVIDWLLYSGHEYERINGEDLESLTDKISISLDSELQISMSNNLQRDYDAIWFRRWSDYPALETISDLSKVLGLKPDLAQTILSIVSQELSALKNIFMNQIPSKKQLTTIDQFSVNKLDVLVMAKKCDLNIPKSLLTNSKEELIKFARLINKNLIIKGINSGFSYLQNNIFYLIYTELLDDKRIAEVPDFFLLSFFQEQIEKKYEIRTFFIGIELYSMAIFSQSNTQTEVDYRKYDNKEPNRNTPYKLPDTVEQKVKKLILELKLTTGSIDIIRGRDGEYYFLEVNPVGQFSNVSEQCNYNLEYEVAKYLTT